MKSIIKSTLVIVLIVIFLLSVSSCGSNQPKEEDIIGKWEIYDTLLFFYPDGTHKRSTTADGHTYPNAPLVGNGTWSLSGNTIKTHTDEFGFIDYVYENDELINGKEIFTRYD